MKSKLFRPALSALALALGLGLGTPSHADPSLVKFSTNANGVYDVTGIVEFDWQSSGDLAIVNALETPTVVGSPPITVTTFSAWAAAAVPGDSVTVKFHSHARLNDMLSGAGGSVAPPTLSKDGGTCAAGSGCFEVTGAISGESTLLAIAPGVVQFTSILGSYKWYYDTTPDTDVGNTNAGGFDNFLDGTAFVQGTLVTASGAFASTGASGNELTSNTIDPSYNANIIQTDSPPLVELNASTFDTLLSLPGPNQARVPVGDPLGLTPYILLSADLLIKADANTEFGALAEPDSPGACRVTGGGNDVDKNLIISNNDNQPYPNSAVIGYSFDKKNRNSYTYGGQVGAPTLLAPGPFGEWTHHQKIGQTNDFVFHAGSHSAPKDTRIDNVVCSDPLPCKPAAANAGFKQIDFEGTGSFRSLKKNGSVNGYAVVTDQGGGGTRHYFRVHIEDLGEPGGSGGPKPNSCSHKPGSIVGNPSTNPGKLDCANCPDIYQIEIHATTNPNSDVIYTVGAYVNGGNLQIHPPVGSH